nr:cryptochrome/photolyase family protein [Thiococcus pfennigii]
MVLVLGDQLDERSSAFDGFEASADAVWMAEVDEESTHVWSHKARIALFLAAMRHFRDTLRRRGLRVEYRQLDDSENRHSLAAELVAAIERLCPRKLILVEPGDWRVREGLRETALAAGVELEVRPDRHFLCPSEQFAEHAQGRKQLRLEPFYRAMRRQLNVLMDGDQPAGGTWNYDKENRGSFGKQVPAPIPVPCGFTPDATTGAVLALVDARFKSHPGGLASFDWPVTPQQARAALEDFIDNRLADFGRVQDAMWTGEPVLYHSRLSAALNLKLLDPRDAIAAAEEAYRQGRAPLAAVEGFVRQLLGWREYVRGVYWLFMPDYARCNALQATRPLPRFYWTGETDLNCLREVIGQTLALGFAHHIQRLMVTGLFALLLGVRPQAVHEWYLAVYVDAVEWVELPNVLGMSQYADGGIMASKPYVATGKYIQRMSNYCSACRYDPGQATGERACPFTTLYWDFLMRHEERLATSPRMRMQLKNLARLSTERKQALRAAAAAWSARLAG